jgi:hypothetical protein
MFNIILAATQRTAGAEGGAEGTERPAKRQRLGKSGLSNALRLYDLVCK